VKGVPCLSVRGVHIKHPSESAVFHATEVGGVFNVSESRVFHVSQLGMIHVSEYGVFQVS